MYKSQIANLWREEGGDEIQVPTLPLPKKTTTKERKSDTFEGKSPVWL